ncbi:hypothetical protein ABZ192_12685 [Streptomyces sp. NPDC006235]|uniref:phage tail protein n=1 Tax=Streptomyces sp. NPDC006235 TaxID=3156736 RepID=UPI0033ACE978
MATLASLTVQLGIDTDRIAAGARRAAASLTSIGRTADSVITDTNGRLRDAQGRFVSMGNSARQAGDNAASGWRRALGVIGRIGSEVGTRVSGAFRTAGQVGGTALGGLTTAFKVMSIGAVGAAGVMAAVPLAIAGLGVMAAAQSEQVKTAFSGLKDHVTKQMQTLAQPLVKPLADAAKQMQGVFDDIAPQLGQMFEAAAPMIKPLVAGVGDLVKGLVSGLVPIMEKAQPLVESLGGLFGTLGEALGGFLSGLSSGIGAAAGIFDGFGAVLGALLPTLGQLMGQMLQVAGPILGRLLSALGPIIEQLGIALMPIITALGPVLNALVDAFLALVTAVMPLLPPISQLVVALLPAFMPILTALVPLFGALGQVVQALVPILTPIITLVAQLATILSNYLAEFITTVVMPAIQAVAALLRGDFSGALELAKTALKNAAEFLKRIFTELPGKLWAAIKPLAAKLGAVALEAGVKLVTALKNKGDEAVKWVKSLPGKAKSALGDLGGILLSAGKSLIQGLINGIVSKIGAVKSTLGDLTGKLTSWKGPAPLDRKILTPNGRMVIGGFLRGIEDQIPQVRKRLQGLTGDLPGMAMDVSPKGVVNAAMRNSQTVTFDVTGADEDMKRLIRRIVKNDGRGDVQTAFGR